MSLIVSRPLVAQDVRDSLQSAARAAEARYERTARWLAPGTYAARTGRCDETVGRFCLNFDTLSKPPAAAERKEVGEARERALRTLRAFSAAAPSDLRAAGPLVRLLVEADRAEDAVAAARAYAESSDDPLWPDWLAGYALHAAGNDSAAELLFERALAHATAAEREHITSIEWLLSRGEWRRVRALSAAARSAYLERFWRVSDPMWLTPANEAWVQHVARHVESWLLARVPRVTGMMRWGRDLEELTVRYGSPIARERDYGRMSEGVSFIEHFDTSALAYAPESLLLTGLPAEEPGERWALKSPAARSGHAPPAIRSAVPLVHQLTRIPHGDSMRVRVDARVALEGTAHAARALLLAQAWSGEEVAIDRSALGGDTVAFTLELRVPRDTMLYATEVLEPESRRLHRARYQLPPLPLGPVQLSDVLLTEPLPPGDSGPSPRLMPALTSTLLTAGQPLGVRVEIAGLVEDEPIDVEVSFARADSPSLVARAAGWIGRKLGVVGEAYPARVRWRATPADDAALQVNLAVPPRPGGYFVEVLVRAARGEAISRRLVRVVSAGGAES